MASVRRMIAGVLAALLAWTCASAAAEPSRPPAAVGSPVRIDGLDVEEVPQLRVGTQLNFSLFGTAGAVATLQIDGARHGLLLRETEQGVYEGTYTIDAQDRIPADGQVVATLRRGAEVATSVLDEPLVLGAAPRERAHEPALAAADPPAVDIRRSAEPRTAATPQTAPGGFDLDSPDDTGPKMRRLPAEASAPVPLPARPLRLPPPLRVAGGCADCAVVESVRTVETAGREGVGGAVAGGLLGAILGGEIAHGDLRGFARILGAIGGALTGREIERANSRRVRYDVLLRRPDGSSQIQSYDSPPPLRVGDTVRLPPVTFARAPRPASPY
jgi:hypothetical protein